MEKITCIEIYLCVRSKWNQKVDLRILFRYSKLSYRTLVNNEITYRRKYLWENDLERNKSPDSEYEREKIKFKFNDKQDK